MPSLNFEVFLKFFLHLTNFFGAKKSVRLGLALPDNNVVKTKDTPTGLKVFWPEGFSLGLRALAYQRLKDYCGYT